MNPDHVQALVARCLAEPEFLATALDIASTTAGQQAAARTSNEAIPDEYVAAALIGREALKRLTLFRGFITKVKHNGLRRVVPLTLSLLGAIELESAFFSAFSAAYVEARASGPLPTDRHLSLLEGHLTAFLDGKPPPTRTLILDILTHETVLWRLSAQDMGTQSAEHSAGEGIRWCGELALRRYDVDVLLACKGLARGCFDRNANWVERRQVLAYFRPDAGERIAVFEADEFTCLAFSLVDGRRNVRNIAAELAQMGLGQITIAELDAFFADAARKGLVQLEGKPATESGAPV